MTDFIKETLKEGWVTFTRYHCKKGYLDRWTGDTNDNPNNPEKRMLNLNSFTAYWRCNNGLWINAWDLNGKDLMGLLTKRKDFTAKEIWDKVIFP